MSRSLVYSLGAVCAICVIAAVGMWTGHPALSSFAATPLLPSNPRIASLHIHAAKTDPPGFSFTVDFQGGKAPIGSEKALICVCIPTVAFLKSKLDLIKQWQKEGAPPASFKVDGGWVSLVSPERSTDAPNTLKGKFVIEGYSLKEFRLPMAFVLLDDDGCESNYLSVKVNFKTGDVLEDPAVPTDGAVVPSGR